MGKCDFKGKLKNAWFAANNKVVATGMTVQAQSEGGIEIQVKDGSTWSTTATATASGVLRPTSTKDTTAWYHASADASTAKTAKNDTYEALSLNATTGKNTATGRTGEQYFLLQEYTIRSSAQNSTASDLVIDSVSVTNTAEQPTTADLDKAIRVLVYVNNKAYIFAPFGGDQNYNIWDGTSNNGPSVSVTANDGVTAVPTDLSTIDYTGTNVKIYVYFEGEDTELKSANLPSSGVTIDTLSVTVNFSATVS